MPKYEDLKVGQVWEGGLCGDVRLEVVAVVPEYVGYKLTNGSTETSPIASFHWWAKRLVKPRHELWVNVFNAPQGTPWLQAWPIKELADHQANHLSCTRIACLKIEFAEGDGL